MKITKRKEILDTYKKFTIHHRDEYDVFYLNLFNEVPIVYYKQTKNNKLTNVIDNLLKYDNDFEFVIIHKELNSNKIINGILIDYANKIMISCMPSWENGIYYNEDTPKNVIQNINNIYNKHDIEDKKVIKKRKKIAKIYTLTLKNVKTRLGIIQKLVFAPFELKSCNIDVQDNYNNDFISKSNEIINKLNEKNENGIVVLHGVAGTGKTYYLRYLCKVIKKRVLYIPPALINNILDPSFMQLLASYKNSILVLEDGDNVLRKRDDVMDMQSVSTILNLTDGILQDILKLQIVATFNTSLKNIDEAFLRKGRLIAEHEFTELSIEKSQKLSDKLGFNTKIEKPMTLADIYNQDKEVHKSEVKTKRIGF